MNRLVGHQLKVAYGKKVIIENMNIDIPDQKISAVIGPNGCGKSTLLKAMCRLIPIQDGQILLDDEDIKSTSSKEIAKKIAILPQSPTVADGLTVGELVSYGRYPYQKGFGRLTKSDLDIIDWAMKVTHTSDFKYRSINDLSGGQRQRVWIAMAIAQRTDIIFLDEPTTFLDIAHQLEVLELITELNKTYGTTIVMVLHDINQAIRFSDYIIAMKAGDVITQGDINDILTDELLKDVFNIDAKISLDELTGRHMISSYRLAEKKYNTKKRLKE
jgi:iron complex transport system ATP-binding protein